MMFTTYIKLSLRNIWKHRIYSIIDILSLGVAIGSVLLVTLFVKDELSYDRFHNKSNQLFRITTTVIDKNGGQQVLGSTGQVQGPSFAAAIPEVLSFVRFMGVDFNVSGEEKVLKLHGLYTDENFLDLFNFPVVSGNAATALAGTHSIVLTEQAAVRLFGSRNVVGRLINLEDGDHFEPFEIKAVVKDLPSNSSIQFEILVPFKFLQQSFKDDSWLDQYLSTFVLIHPQAYPDEVERKFSAVFRDQAHKQLLAISEKEGFKPYRNYGLQPITDIHLNTMRIAKKSTGGEAGGISNMSDLSYSYILTGIAGFILLMACINFVNLSIGNSLRRAKEIGVRKISGSTRRQIIGQFLIESSLLCFAGFLFALFLCYWCLPLFNVITNRNLEINKLLDIKLLATALLILALTILLAGLYPSILISRFNPTEVLYNKIKLGGRHWFGKSLVVFQFSLAICLIIATIVYYSQMKFISEKNLGYNGEDVIRFFLPLKDPKIMVPRVKYELSSHAAIKLVATGTDNSDAVRGGFPTKINGREVSYVLTSIDENFLPLLNIPVKDGRNFSKKFVSDKGHAAIVNDAFVKAAGLTKPLGVKFENTWGGTNVLTIVGVVNDYHYGSLKTSIYPQVMILTEDLSFFWLKIHPGKQAEALGLVENVFKHYAPDYPAQYSFLQDDVDSLYKNEKRWQQVINYAAILSIFICCVGLFGLANLTAAQRIKEIGIRKVLGASVSNIVYLFSARVIKLVLLATLVAFPISWLGMTQWLENFAYRVQFSWWFFIIAALATVVIALFTVIFHALKVAIANPVKTLKME